MTDEEQAKMMQNGEWPTTLPTKTPWIPPSGIPAISQPSPVTEKSELNKEFDKNLDEVHIFINSKLDGLQKVIDEVRLMINDSSISIKNKVEKHLLAAEDALLLTDKVSKELEQIKISLNS